MKGVLLLVLVFVSLVSAPSVGAGANLSISPEQQALLREWSGEDIMFFLEDKGEHFEIGSYASTKVLVYEDKLSAEEAFCGLSCAWANSGLFERERIMIRWEEL